MITRESLAPFESLGVVAAAKALRRSTRTINQLARELGFYFKTFTEREQYRRERHRKSLAGQVRALALKRLSQREICEELGITRWVLRHIAKEHRIDINSRSYG